MLKGESDILRQLSAGATADNGAQQYQRECECLGGKAEGVVARKIIPRLAERIEFIETEMAKLEKLREVCTDRSRQSPPAHRVHCQASGRRQRW